MGSASLAAARPAARPPARPPTHPPARLPARTVTTIPLQPRGLRGKKDLKMSSVKWQQFCLGLNVLMDLLNLLVMFWFSLGTINDYQENIILYLTRDNIDQWTQLNCVWLATEL